MKNIKKKSIIIVIIILLVIGVLSILIHKNSKYIIPDNYIKKIEKHMSYLDGPDEDIYVYDDKIVVEENGLEPQLKGHIQGNLNIGNDKQKLLDV